MNRLIISQIYFDSFTIIKPLNSLNRIKRLNFKFHYDFECSKVLDIYEKMYFFNRIDAYLTGI